MPELQCLDTLAVLNREVYVYDAAVSNLQKHTKMSAKCSLKASDRRYCIDQMADRIFLCHISSREAGICRCDGCLFRLSSFGTTRAVVPRSGCLYGSDCFQRYELCWCLQKRSLGIFLVSSFESFSAN